MHYPITLATALFSLAAASGAVIEFESAGTTKEGFIIPENIPDGVYEVSMDGNGVARHLKLAENGDAAGRAPSADRNNAISAGPSARLSRRDYGYDCGPYQNLDWGWTDETVRDVANQCGEYREVGGGLHIYSVRGNVATFFCNFNIFPTACFSNQIWDATREITNRCGSYVSGWADYYNIFKQHSIGYHQVGPEKSFCGQDHF